MNLNIKSWTPERRKKTGLGILVIVQILLITAVALLSLAPH